MVVPRWRRLIAAVESAAPAARARREAAERVRVVVPG